MLLGRSLFRVLETDLGVVTDRVATTSLSLDVDRQLTAAQQTALIDRVVETFRGVPGTEAVGVGASLPPHANRIILTMRRTGDAGPVDYRAIAIPATPGYFSTPRIPLLRGRLFTEADDASRPQVIVMSAATARRFFGEGDPIGRTMSLPTFRDGAAAQAEMTLVGVIGDVKYSGLDQAPDDAVYRPFAQQPWPSVFLVARTAGDPASLAQTLRERLSRIDPALSVTAVNTLDDVISDEAAQPRFRTLVLAALAGLALTLAAVGLYGVVGYSVSQRTGEIGVRMAIGASATDIIMMIVREGMQMATVGVALGIAGAYALARLLTGLLYGVAPNDAPSFAIACLSLLLFALIATYSPAYRATRIDPSIALRAE
jgi:putative ABC transport system permease protein